MSDRRRYTPGFGGEVGEFGDTATTPTRTIGSVERTTSVRTPHKERRREEGRRA